MNITATQPSAANLQALLQDRYHDFNQLQTALQSGNLSSAQQAFAAFQQDAQKSAQLAGQGSLFGQGSQASKDLQALGGALQSADLSAAQKAFATLAHDLTAASAAPQATDTLAIHHPNRAANSARIFGNNALLNGSAITAGQVLNQQA